MTRAQWLAAKNESLAQFNLKIVRTKENDPNFTRFGDYFVVRLDTQSIVRSHLTFLDFLPEDMLRRLFSDWKVRQIKESDVLRDAVQRFALTA